MKNVLTKMGYMAVGCLLTLIGYHFGNVENNNVSAQQSSESAINIVDRIRVRQLEIVDDDDTLRVKLDKESIELYNKEGFIRAAISVDLFDRGRVVVLGKGHPQGSAAILGVDRNGGRVALMNNFGSWPGLDACITNNGEAIVTTYDKTGETTAFLGSSGNHTYEIHRWINFPRSATSSRSMLSLR